MFQFVVKVITLLFVLFSNIISLGMEATATFDIQLLSDDLQRHIFVVAHPSIQNQLKISSKSWHAIGAKKAPNMYKLVNNPSFCASHDDWCYIMMHAVLDKKIDVMRTILKCTNQRNFDYDFGVDYLGNGKKKSFLLSDVLHSSELETTVCEELKELDLRSGSDECKVGFESDLFKACFAGDMDTVQILKINSRIIQFYGCIVMAVYNNNPYCIKTLSFQVSNIVHDQLHLDLLRLAMRNNKKRAFKALVKNNVYSRLNGPTGRHPGRNTTILDELNEQTDISDLAKYIEIYKQLGGKTWQEVKQEEEESENYEEDASKNHFSAITFCSLQ